MYTLKSILRANIWYNPIFYGQSIICNGKDKALKIYNLDSLTLKRTLVTNFGKFLFADNGNDCLVYNINNLDEGPIQLTGITALPAYIDEQFIYSNCKAELSVTICKYDYHKREKVASFNYQISNDANCVGDRLIFSERAFFSRKIYCIEAWFYSYGPVRSFYSY